MTSNTPKSVWRQRFVMNTKNKSAKCKYCPKELKTCGNTSNLKQHIQRKHPAVILDDQNCSEADSSQNLDRTVTDSEETPRASTSKTDTGPVTSTPKRVNGANIVKGIENTFGRAKHIRCVAHTLNLVVDNCVKEPNIKSVLDKVRKIVTWFHQSGVGAEELRKSQTEQNVKEGKLKHLIGDVSTRWNSQLFMIDRFVLMSSNIGSILINHPNAPQMLNAHEIVTLKEMSKILRPFQKVTEEMSADKYVSASKAIPIIKCLRCVLETVTPTNELSVELKNSLQNELAKRFDQIQKVHLFSVATFLDPRFKKIHLDDALALSKTISYIKRYLSHENPTATVNAQQPSTFLVATDDDDIWQTHHQKIMAASTMRSENSITSELDLYIAAPILDLKTDALALWKSYQGAYPKLTELALKHLLVMASSAPAERLFSKAGNILRKSRSRILGKRLPKLIFLHSLPDQLW